MSPGYTADSALFNWNTPILIDRRLFNRGQQAPGPKPGLAKVGTTRGAPSSRARRSAKESGRRSFLAKFATFASRLLQSAFDFCQANSTEELGAGCLARSSWLWPRQRASNPLPPSAAKPLDASLASVRFALVGAFFYLMLVWGLSLLLSILWSRLETLLMPPSLSHVCITQMRKVTFWSRMSHISPRQAGNMARWPGFAMFALQLHTHARHLHQPWLRRLLLGAMNGQTGKSMLQAVPNFSDIIKSRVRRQPTS